MPGSPRRPRFYMLILAIGFIIGGFMTALLRRFLPESPTFHGHLTGAEFLEFQARLAGLPAAGRRSEIARLLAEVGMRGRENTLIRRCSKGSKRET